MREELPSGWAEVALHDVCTRVSQIGPNPESETFRYIDSSAIDNRTKRVSDASSLQSVSAPSRAKQVVATGDVLFSTVSVYLENIALVPEELDGAVASTAFTALRPSRAIDSGYLYRLVSSKPFIQKVNALQRGNSPPSVQDADVRAQRIPLPPLAEQQRIVSRIEELFSEIDEGERALERAGRLVERYRHSVLEAAVTGELTRDWRERNPASSVSGALSRFVEARTHARRNGPPATPAAVDDLPELPSSWAWASLDALADVVGGITVDRKRSSVDCDEVPYLRVANVQRGHLDLAEVKTIVAPRERIDQLRLRPGDILFNEGGDIDKLGRGWLWQGELPLCIHQNHVFRARQYVPGPWNKLISWFGNVLGKRLFMDMGKQTTNLASLSLSKLKSLPVPLMSGEEAAEIVSRAEDALSVVDKCIAELVTQQRESSSLRQSVLKAAFSCQLVPQDPADEPAAALLARIAAQAADAPATARRRGHRS